MEPHPARGGRHLSVSIVRRGKGHLLTCEQWVDTPPAPCFEFFSDASNLEVLTPPFLAFRILTPMPIEMRTGAIIEYRLSLLGLPMTWVSRIEDWRPGRSFTDVQLRGPYARWVHRHSFIPTEAGTLVRDEVEYALPLAPLSGFAHERFVRPRLRQIFEFRSAVIARLAG